MFPSLRGTVQAISEKPAPLRRTHRIDGGTNLDIARRRCLSKHERVTRKEAFLLRQCHLDLQPDATGIGTVVCCQEIL